MQDRKRLEEQIAQDAKISGLTSDLDTMFELGREGEEVAADLEREMKSFSGYLETLETQMLLSGDNASKFAIVTIHPGAGGTESQDWAEMLMRMYYRWAERNRFEIVETDRLEGEGAGIKSATFEVNGENAYGLLQSEIGVHRLVRISPFDANARRHTSSHHGRGDSGSARAQARRIGRGLYARLRRSRAGNSSAPTTRRQTSRPRR